MFDDLEHLHDKEDYLLESTLRSYIERKKLSQQRVENSKNRRFRQRKSWSRFQYNMTDRQFRRYFRMSRECFHYLCEKIKENVGESEFKSESYLQKLGSGVEKSSPQYQNFMKGHEDSTGGFISGEIKLALTLRLLAGGSYLDLSLLFEMGQTYSFNIFHDVIKNWILDERLVKIDGIDYVSDEQMLSKVALHFAQQSNGVLNGCIGAIDGWIVKTKMPMKTKDRVCNPTSFYSRKGYYGINVQVKVDKNKRVVFRDISSRGAEHDSTAWKNSPLYTWCIDNWEYLAEKGFYFIGDSAYSFMSFLVTPFENVLHQTEGDNFNFFHSSSRIIIECTFGEVGLR